MIGAETIVARVPERLSAGRYVVGVTVRNVKGDATDSPPDLVPFLWNFHAGPFGSGKANMERELRAAGIDATVVTAGNPRWQNPRRSGFLDVFGLSPVLWDVSFEVTIDVHGPRGSGVSGLGVAPVVLYVGGTALVVGIAHAIVSTLGGGDVVIDFVRKILDAPLRVAGAAAGRVVQEAGGVVAAPFKSLGGWILLAGLGVGAYLYFTKSPKGRLVKRTVWG